MKTHSLAISLALGVALSSAAHAGNPVPAVSDPVVIVQDTADSGGHILVPVLALIFLGAGLLD